MLTRIATALPPIDWRSPRLPLGLSAVIVIVPLLAFAAATWLGIERPLHYGGVPLVERALPLHTVPVARQVALFGLDSPAAPPSALPGASPDPAAPRLEVDPQLIDWRDGIALPRIAADGRRPLEVYARATPAATAEQAKIALLVVDLGLDGERLGQSVQLPADLGLVHTPYAAHLAAWQRHARGHGHEVFLELPLQAADFPSSDFGPWALRPTTPPATQLAALDRILARSDGYVGLAAASEAFAEMAERFTPLAAALTARGLGFVELGADRLAGAAAAAGLAYASAVGPLDAVAEAAAIDAALGQLEGLALRDGSALGYVQPYPVTFDRLWHWQRTLAGKGIALVPVSHFLPVP